MLSHMSLLNEAYGAVTQDKQMYVLVVGSLLADEAHNYFMHVFVYCSPLLASTLALDNF